MKKKNIIILIILCIILFFWFIPVIRTCIFVGSGSLYNPGNKYGKYDDSIQSCFNFTLKDFLLSKFGY